jgi:hypothetical protein
MVRQGSEHIADEPRGVAVVLHAETVGDLRLKGRLRPELSLDARMRREGDKGERVWAEDPG